LGQGNTSLIKWPGPPMGAVCITLFITQSLPSVREFTSMLETEMSRHFMPRARRRSLRPRRDRDIQQFAWDWDETSARLETETSRPRLQPWAVSPSLRYYPESNAWGNKYKLLNRAFHYDLRKHSFGARILNSTWRLQTQVAVYDRLW